VHEGGVLTRCGEDRRRLEVAQMLLEHGVDPNARSITDKDPLYVAPEKGNPGLAQLLLEHGGDTNARGVGGRSLLHVSCRKGDWGTHRVSDISHARETRVKK
jgi:ankyrin repeat protein